MSDIQLKDPDPILQHPGEAGLTDRRRRGRSATAHPNLLPLLRHANAGEVAELEAMLAERAPDELQAGRGIMLAALVSMPLWLVVGWALRPLLPG